MGENNGMYGKHQSIETIEKIRARAKKRFEDPKEREKQRLTAIKRIENNLSIGGQIQPWFNPRGCQIIDNYGNKNGYKFKHEMNGGEICISGYFPDGLDEERKTIIEIDEKHHYDTHGNLKKKDVDRQKYLEGLGYKFIRIKI